MAAKKLIGKMHLWLGLSSGLVVFILGLTGCLYSFIEEIKPLVYRDRMFVEVPAAAKRLPLDVLRANAQIAVGENHPVQVAEVNLGANRTVSFRALKVNPEAILYSRYMEYYYRIYVNPYTGKVVKVENTKWEFFQMVVTLHVSLMLGPKVGGQIVTWSVVIFVILLISGIILWWPKNKAAAKQRFSFKWKDTTQWKRKNYDLHNILGFYAMILLLVVSFTGLIWCFEWLNKSVQWMANGGKSMEQPAPVFSDTTNTNAFAPDKILQAAVQQDPHANTLFISIPKDNKSAVFVFGRKDKKPLYTNTRSQYDQHTARLLSTTSFATMNNGEKAHALNYDLHVGSVLGLPGKILVFFASLIAASLPLTGFYIWWGRKNKKTAKAKPKQSTPARKKLVIENVKV
ncbi:Uncharacterized iron-regulated membrane protein [Chitinophaga sp. CF118]|uniref:PepSY-associated TM helix domain-containing protein n=1 Tax=Chitinophaga sp. CF118 TaxID=1884367 RepID=UPI0008E36745|nr:PepSY-associated TM helix domain-containing protein [Chitinophaga sp. CF118]SFD62558.1 Uncharacterized iron-regulated membrane protein [Chitinophaga sp. CF118]